MMCVRRMRLAAVLTTAVALPLVLTNCESLLPKTAWNGDWGPLVPHESFPGDCSICHHPGGWDRVKSEFTFDHFAETGYALLGAHEDAMCLRCHNDRGPVTDFSDRGCGGCHVDPHRTQLGSDCEQCHDVESWRPNGIVEQHAATRFPLFGAHLTAPCESCHRGAEHGEFRGAPTGCEFCHADDVARATSPDHAASGLTNDCGRCHNAFGWQGAGFDHDFFPLVGGHAGNDCEACHPGRVFLGTSSDCISCHQDEYSTAPNHQSYATTCQDCHDIFDWGNASIDHSFFPLIGGHSSPACEQCHVNGLFAGTSDTCFSCHSEDYLSAPGHASYATTCQDCHDIFDWENAAIDHSFFPLIGGHSSPGCEECHSSGVYAGLPSDCWSCHQSDYGGAPDHVALSFPHSCEDCHSIFNWNANFDHDFPLSGPHNRDCTDCHIAGTTSTFSCYGTCHEHSQSRCDNDHDEVGGYSYSFPACLACHPDGND